ncbi:MAG: sigma-70 family RNA polymerase sigma factor [Gammaproteobacteria bacterium]|nr:sigma-70 family RNA polymerase sigma factor [Gammaproteobacteria bacterium]
MSKAHVTELLHAWQNGDQTALEKVMPFLHSELRRLATQHMRRENAGHTLQATALVNEAYLKLVGVELEFHDRAHFLALASRVMRRILVDHARARQRVKRGSGLRPVTLDESRYPSDNPDFDLVDLDEALNNLAEFDARMAKSVELLYFGGLTTTEAAAALGISRVTLNKDMQLARAWLYKELK